MADGGRNLALRAQHTTRAGAPRTGAGTALRVKRSSRARAGRPASAGRRGRARVETNHSLTRPRAQAQVFRGRALIRRQGAPRGRNGTCCRTSRRAHKPCLPDVF